MANRIISNRQTVKAMDSVARVLNERMKEAGLIVAALARKSGIERKTIAPMVNGPYKMPHFENMINVLDAAGLKSITITWRDEDDESVL